eukprot:TRINITY_DN67123_c0_g1_i1.p1 TRINITY_DN67123_c0_g1~~TRINITY_DN67123_c0_g1_i1.p1  ORF type:complete len:667 (-),score=59.37 TRINITY_DN67123_c0_g1_i1:676-2676(-)
MPVSNTFQFSKVVPRVKHTMEDFTRWTEKDVRQWVVDESQGVSLLEKELEKNLYAFNEYNGAKINMLTGEDMLYLGVSFKSRDILIKCLDELRSNEALLKSRRRKAEKLKTAFLKSDEDGNGIVEQEELTKIVKKTYPDISDHLTAVYYDIIRTYCDPEHTGTINIHDLMAADHEKMMMTIMTEAEKAEEVEVTFNELDVDGSGELDREELRALIDQCYPNAGPTVRRKYYNQIIRECDRNNDGTISLPEIFNSSYVRLLLGGDQAPVHTGVIQQNSWGPGTSRPTSPTNSVPPVSPLRSSSPPPRPGSPTSGGRPGSARSMNMRCAPRSPRLMAHGSNTGAPVHKSPRVEKFEVNNFKPLGHSGAELLDKAEGILDEKVHSHNQWQEALEFFTDAAEQFEVEDKLERAGGAYERAGDCLQKLGRDIEAADLIRMAAERYKKVDAQKAIDCLMEAADIFFSKNRQRLGAKLWYDISELYEMVDDLENAVDWCTKVLEHYKAPEDSKTKFKAMMRIAQLYTRLEMYQEAADMCQEVFHFVRELNDKEGCASGVHPQHGAYALFMCVLCTIANIDFASPKLQAKGTEIAEACFAEFQQYDKLSKEHELLHAVLCACAERSAEALELGFDRWKFKTTSGSGDKWINLLLNAISSRFAFGIPKPKPPLPE